MHDVAPPPLKVPAGQSAGKVSPTGHMQPAAHVPHSLMVVRLVLRGAESESVLVYTGTAAVPVSAGQHGSMPDVTHENVLDDSDAGTVPVRLFQHRSTDLSAHTAHSLVTRHLAGLRDVS